MSRLSVCEIFWFFPAWFCPILTKMMFLPRALCSVRQASVLHPTRPAEMASVPLSSHICRPVAGVVLCLTFCSTTPQHSTKANSCKQGEAWHGLQSWGTQRPLLLSVVQRLHHLHRQPSSQKAHLSSPEPSDVDPAKDAQGITLTRLYPMPLSPA